MDYATIALEFFYSSYKKFLLVPREVLLAPLKATVAKGAGANSTVCASPCLVEAELPPAVPAHLPRGCASLPSPLGSTGFFFSSVPYPGLMEHLFFMVLALYFCGYRVIGGSLYLRIEIVW